MASLGSGLRLQPQDCYCNVPPIRQHGGSLLVSVASFDSTKLFIQEMLENIGKGKLQLPDFQRGWVWDDDHIRSLVASLSLSFPIGAVMTLDAGGTFDFQPRPIEGTVGLESTKPDILILDGQQRLTSLYQCLLRHGPVETKDSKDNKIKRRYYLDMKQCVDEDAEREEAVIAVPEDGVLRTFRGEIVWDLSSPEQEYKQDIFPLQHIFDPSSWQQGLH